MTEKFNLEEYKKIVAKYAQFKNVLDNFDKAQYDPGVRALIGEGVFGDSRAYVNAGSDSIFIGTKNLTTHAADNFRTSTKENLEEILSGSSDKIGDVGLISYFIENAPVYEPEKDAKYKVETEKHKEASEAIKIAKSGNVGAMAESMIKFAPEYEEAIRYHMVNNPTFKSIYERGILQSKLRDALSQFILKKETEKSGEPKLNGAKIKNYMKYVLSGIEDPEQFSNLMLPLMTQVYLIEEDSKSE